MKTRNFLAALTLLISFAIQAQMHPKFHCLWGECNFQPGQLIYAFGDNVKLRTAPNTNAKVLDYLPIGHPVLIVEKTTETMTYNGYESPFYKVEYENATGYILGALLSLEKKEINGNTLLFSYKKEGDATFLLVRNRKSDGSYTQDQVPLANSMLSLEVKDSDIESLGQLLYVSYLAEACGVEGGGIYLLPTQDSLVQLAELSQISEAGQFWYSERFIFPADEGGIPQKILFKKERNVTIDEGHNWVSSSEESVELSWVNGKLFPDFRKNQN